MSALNDDFLVPNPNDELDTELWDDPTDDNDASWPEITLLANKNSTNNNLIAQDFSPEDKERDAVLSVDARDIPINNFLKLYIQDTSEQRPKVML